MWDQIFQELADGDFETQVCWVKHVAAQVVEKWVVLLLLDVWAEESFHVEGIVLHHEQVVEDIDAVVFQHVELSQFAVLPWGSH